MSHPEADLAKVLRAIADSIGVKESWVPYPGGHPEEVEAALLDSVFSLMATQVALDSHGDPETV